MQLKTESQNKENNQNKIKIGYLKNKLELLVIYSVLKSIKIKIFMILNI